MAFFKQPHKKFAQQTQTLKFEKLEPRILLTADPIITEFMTSNNDVLHDGYGASPDWIEIYNNGDQSVDLENYSLTDNAGEIDKWQFPQTVLAPGEYLVVFASSIDTIDPDGNLHTNFGLSSGGEYLALADPTGTILSEFSPGGSDYPEQTSGTSYGLAFDSTFTEAISPNSLTKYLIPSDNSVDATWTNTSFNDSAWANGTASIGYETTVGVYDNIIQTTVPANTEAAYVRIPFQINSVDDVIGTLSIKYDDGFIAYLNGVQIAAANAPSTIAYNSHATELHVKEAAVQDAIFNVSDYSTLLQVGSNVLSIHLMDADDSSSNDLLISTSLTVGTGNIAFPETVGKLITPTPGLPNTQALASDVAYSRTGGVFANPFQLSLTASGSDTIRYTLDGSEPLATSLLYAGPITISTTTQVRARTYDASGNPGAASSAAFSQSTLSLANSQSTLPIIVLENFAGGKPNREFQDAFLSLYEVDETTGVSSFLDTPTLTTSIGQHRRGSSSYNSGKYSLRIELRDDNGEDKDVSLLDMPSNSDWILYGAGTFDRSLLRNAVAYDLSNQAENPAVRTRYVTVYNNTAGGPISESQYYGIYVLMETIKEGEDRVNLDASLSTASANPTSPDGYIYKRDRSSTDEDSSWTTSRNFPLGPVKFVHVSPERAELDSSQTSYLRDYIQQFENTLNSSNRYDLETGYSAYIAPDSWVEHHLMRLFIADTDRFSLSEFFTLNRGGKIEAGPIWDFNFSSGWNGAAPPTSWNSRDFNFTASYWAKLFDDPNFSQLWVDKWWSLRSGVLSDTNLEATVSGHAAEIEVETARNFDKWTQYPSRDGGLLSDPLLTGWEADVDHFKEWLLAQAQWIDTQMTPPVEFSLMDGEVQNGTQITLSTNDSGAEIYYTIDGTDPRGNSGILSPSAILYTTPVSINSATKIVARALNSSRSDENLGPWSSSSVALYSTEVAADITNLRISELHYNPLDPTASELLIVPDASNNSFEFIELMNISEQPIYLNGVRFTDGVTFGFSSSNIATLAPGEIVLVVKDTAAFEARYGNSLSIAGEYSGKLSGNGEYVTLVDALDNVIHNFEYGVLNPWPEAADGSGPSLEVVDILGNLNAPTNWQASSSNHGNPGVTVAPLHGDYDRNGTVDQLDYSTWVSQYGNTVEMPGMGADGNLDGVIDAADYTVWRDHLGDTTPPPIQAPAQATQKASDATQTLEPVRLPETTKSSPDKLVSQSNENSLVSAAILATVEFPNSSGQSYDEQPLFQEESYQTNWHDVSLLFEKTNRDFLNSKQANLTSEQAVDSDSDAKVADTVFFDWKLTRFPGI